MQHLSKQASPGALLSADRTKEAGSRVLFARCADFRQLLGSGVVCNCLIVVSPGASNWCIIAVLVSLDCAAVAELFGGTASSASRGIIILWFDSAFRRQVI
jgi:hypothetical protein